MVEEQAESGRRLSIQIISTHYAPEATGNAPYATGLATGLASRGHRVSVLAGAPHYPGWRTFPQEQWLEEEDLDGVHVRRLASFIPEQPTFLSRLRYEIQYGLKFASRVDNAADAIVLLSPSLFASLVVRARALTMASRRRSKVVLWMQDLYSAGLRETPGLPARAMAGLMAACEGTLARSCDQVVVIHDRFRRFVTDVLHVAATDVSVIRNWSHIEASLVDNREGTRRRLGWDSGDVVVLHAGNMGEKQGLQNVVQAARWAEATGFPVCFVLLGDGNQRAALEQLGRGCTHLQFLPPVANDEFVDLLRAADVLLVNERPSLNEAAVPSKLTSYFVTGLPILAATSEGSTTSDEIRFSGAGSVVEPGNPEALARAAQELHGRWTDADALRGPAFVRDVLSAKASLDAFEALFARLLEFGDHDSGITNTTEKETNVNAYDTNHGSEWPRPR